MMTEEEKIFAGQLFCPGHPDLKAIKLRSHNLCTQYNRLFEDESEPRNELLAQIVGKMGKGCFMQGPIFFHYGSHTTIGEAFFGNYNLTIQDDARVTIGDNCNFGPNVTIVTPIHPMLPDERLMMRNEEGKPTRFCYAKPVTVGNDVWLGANVVICGGTTVGDGCVIGAGSVIVKDIPPMTFAAGNPCRVIRPITQEDSMVNKPEILGDNSLL